MEIERAHIATTFKLSANRDELETLKICLHQVYHYDHNKIPKKLVSVASHLMDRIDDAIQMDDEIHRTAKTGRPWQ